LFIGSEARTIPLRGISVNLIIAIMFRTEYASAHEGNLGRVGKLGGVTAVSA
jgi:hypothetical protein